MIQNVLQFMVNNSELIFGLLFALSEALGFTKFKGVLRTIIDYLKSRENERG